MPPEEAPHETIHSVNCPIFPAEKDADVPLDETPIAETTTIQIFIRLAEPVVFIQGFNAQQIAERPPSMLRGSLVVRVLKPSKLKSISLNFKGYSRTDWPEGIPPKKQEFVEINDIVNHTWPFYESSSPHLQPTTSFSSINLDEQSKETQSILKETGASIFRSPSTPNISRSSTAAKFSALNLHAKDEKVKTSQDVPNRKLSIASIHSIGAHSNTNDSGGAIGTLSPISMLRKATTTASNAHDQDTPKPARSTMGSSIFSDFLGNPFSSNTEHLPSTAMTKNLSNSSIANYSSHHHDAYIFQPGDYIYTFEQGIPCSYPETVKADFGFVEYSLFVTVERHGAFKSNVTAKLPVTLIRTQSDSSIEETEPIAITRDWENQLHYDIVIASKDIILDAFLPIAFRFSPIDKVTLHRIRIYLTETVEYYCKGKKVHRVEPTKKFLLAEHNGPKLESLSADTKSSKAKYLGNLLVDDKSGDLVNKDFDYQVYIPSSFANSQKLHPDTGFEKIKSNHWIKLCLRLSKITDGKRKHYEIVIDSPIHILHKLCSHANTLLPCYDSHLVSHSIVSSDRASGHSKQFNHQHHNNHIQGHSADFVKDSQHYHDSNIFFPKEVLLSPTLSPDVHPIDLKHSQNIHPRQFDRQLNSHSTSGHISVETSTADMKEVFNSPRLKANLYHPDSIQMDLISSQAIPLSPIISPILSPSLTSINDDAPPSFDFDSDVASTMRSESDKMPVGPPAYTDVLKADGIMVPTHQRVRRLKTDSTSDFFERHSSGSISDLSKQGSHSDMEGDEDIASSFTFQGNKKSSNNLPNAILRSHSTSFSHIKGHRESFGRTGSIIQDSLPSTMRYDNRSFNDLNSVLAEHENSVSMQKSPSSTSSCNQTIRSELDNFNSVSSRPLLNQNTSDTERNLNDSILDLSVLGSEDVLADASGASFDITSFCHDNSNSWHPLKSQGIDPISPITSHNYSFNVANSNHVLDDFKSAFSRETANDARAVSGASNSTLKPRHD